MTLYSKIADAPHCRAFQSDVVAVTETVTLAFADLAAPATLRSSDAVRFPLPHHFVGIELLTTAEGTTAGSAAAGTFAVTAASTAAPQVFDTPENGGTITASSPAQVNFLTPLASLRVTPTGVTAGLFYRVNLFSYTS